MTSEQRIAEWVDRLDTGLIDTDSLALVRAALPDLIASVRAEAIEEAAKVCEQVQHNFTGGAPDWQGGCVECAANIRRALAKERKGSRLASHAELEGALVKAYCAANDYINALLNSDVPKESLEKIAADYWQKVREVK